MPRVFINTQEKLNHRLATWVIGEMRSRRISQVDLARERGISQQAISMKLKVERFDFEDLCCFVRVLKPDIDDIQRLLGI
jgi:predicted transcriptional regulator